MEDGDVIERKEGEIQASEEEEVMEEPAEEAKEEAKPSTDAELSAAKDKYLRLYAEFENYKRRVQKDKEELIKYGNESLLFELLTVIDNLEMALCHANAADGLTKGVEITLREFQRVMEKFGVTPIEAMGKCFDPSEHHAMTQAERADVEEGIVVEEFRKGYKYRNKILRPSLVAVSKRPAEAEAEEVKITIESKEE